MKKHSRTLNNLLVILTAAALISCGKESPRTDYVARVNNSYLTEKDIDRIINSSPGTNFYRNEIIRNWVNREILFLKARDEGILSEEQYTRVIEDSKKELAAAMLLEKTYDADDLVISENEIEDYYNLNKEEFRLNDNFYLINSAKFKSEDAAVTFRNLVVETSWEITSEDFSDNYPSAKQSSSLFIAEDEIHPITVLRVVRELYPEEISIILNETPDEFTIVQMLQKYDEGTIPPQALIKEKIHSRLQKKKKHELLQNYVKELYSEFDIEIRQEKK